MGERTSAGDPARTIALLWRDPAAVPRHGPPRTWDLDAVVAAATGLADAGGLESVTMRRVAEAVGAAPMTLYTYVPGKAELLDLMLDAAYAAMRRTDTAGRPWVDRLRAIAEENRILFTDHPWTASVATGRPPLGPGAIAKYEHELAAFDGLGLDDVDRDSCLAYLLEIVRAAARAAHDARAARDGSGLDDAQWWAVAGPRLAGVLDRAAYPRAIRIGSATGAAHRSAADPDHAYRFGLDRALDGIGLFLDRHARLDRQTDPAAEPPLAGPAARLDALDTELSRGRRGRGADRPTADEGSPDDRSA